MPTSTAGGTLLAGRYRVVERLGVGGMASVYLAHDERLDRDVAVKQMHTTDREDIDARRFEREAKLGASLSHSNLVSVFDIHEGDESVLLVMEYVAGETLADLMRRGPIEPRRAVKIVRAVAEALDHAHAAGIVHRDIKPGNVLLGRDGSVKLADLGIAKAVERTDLTKTDTVLGTPAYMAPEQLEGRRIGPPVDIYALATVAFEMVTGRKARRGRSAVEIAHQVVNDPAPDPREANPDVPAAAAEAIRAGMARNPAERPRSAAALAEQLEQAFSREGARWHAPITQRMEKARPVALIPHDPPRVTPPSRNVRWIPAVALLALALAAVVIAIGSSGGGEDSSPTPASDGKSKAAKKTDDRASAPTPAATADDEAAAAPAPLDGVPEPSGAGGTAEAERLHLDGFAALEAGDYDRAIELNTQAIEAFPEGTTWQSNINYAYALYSLGKALRLAGRPDEAIPVLEARLAIPNQTATVQTELDLARKAAGE